MERMSERTGLIVPMRSLSLLLVQTQAARWKAAVPEQLTRGHLYLAKSGYLFHGYPGWKINYVFDCTGSNSIVSFKTCP